MLRVTGWSVTLPASMVQRRSHSAEPGTAGCVILASPRPRLYRPGIRAQSPAVPASGRPISQ
jgi:hypothetical protein